MDTALISSLSGRPVVFPGGGTLKRAARGGSGRSTQTRVAGRRPSLHAATAGVIEKVAKPLTKEGFAPFGQVCGPIDDMVGFGPDDAQLDLSRGIPRFYIMTLPRKGAEFDRITHHKEVTQCLGSLGGHDWYMAVAAPSDSRPAPEDITCFRIPYGTFVKMDKGTWHAGPYFCGPEEINFYNLELADTNQVDHATHVYSDEGVSFLIKDAAGLV